MILSYCSVPMALPILLLLYLGNLCHGFLLPSGLTNGPTKFGNAYSIRIVSLRCDARPKGSRGIQSLDNIWFPKELAECDGHGPVSKEEIEELQERSLELCSTLLRQRLQSGRDVNGKSTATGEHSEASEIARGKFVDLCCTKTGEKQLESLFDSDMVEKETSGVIQGAVICLQSLAILGMQFGAKGSQEQAERSIFHLDIRKDQPETVNEDFQWDQSSARRLKFLNDCDPGLQLLAKMKRKRSPQGAFELLTNIRSWKIHEDLALLRSGFPLGFSAAEIDAAEKAAENERDPDALLGIRKDLRSQKVYTIDGASTREIDDGLSVEVIDGDGKTEKQHRIWIHIADADRWAPRDSEIFQAARQRATSLYLPQESLPMFPHEMGSELMSLKAKTDSYALSLGVILAADGSIETSEVVLTPSTIRVSYRLTYDDVDEMLEDGIAYNEEWELGVLYSAAMSRRQFRIGNSSAEAFVPTQIPQFQVSTYSDKEAADGTGIKLDISVSHNGGKNQSAVALNDGDTENKYASPLSAASMLVTEMMILSGEAIGQWRLQCEKSFLADEKSPKLLQPIRLPFRFQPPPDFKSRQREAAILSDLLKYNVGGGYCHAWYARRFLSPVQVVEEPAPHSGLGLQWYCQWSSPIRRFTDLQVHAAVKRYIRRQRLIELLESKEPIPRELTSVDFGCEISKLNSTEFGHTDEHIAVDADIDYSEGSALVGAARRLQRTSQRYWILEFIRRLKVNEPAKEFEATILGCTNPSRRQYAIYIDELGLEWKYISPVTLQAGDKITVKVANVLPQNGQMTLVQI